MNNAQILLEEAMNQIKSDIDSQSSYGDYTRFEPGNARYKKTVTDQIEIGDTVQVVGEDHFYTVESIDNRLVFLRCPETGCAFWAKRSEISICQTATW